MDTQAIARLMGVKVDSVRTYHARAVARRAAGQSRPGDMPAPSGRVGNCLIWQPEDILAWLVARPGRGVGGGRPRKPQEGSS